MNLVVGTRLQNNITDIDGKVANETDEPIDDLHRLSQILKVGVVVNTQEEE